MIRKSISFDFWGTIAESNPKFEKAFWSYLVTLNTKLETFKEYKDTRSSIKKQYKDKEKDGIQIPKLEIWGPIISSIPSEIIDFLALTSRWDFLTKIILPEYHRLFLKYPPLIKSNIHEIISQLKEQDYRIFISSDTCFVHGNTLREFLKSEFDIVSFACNFSDEKSCTKPEKTMFTFFSKGYKSEFPDFHVGDNLVTDGKCVDYGIKFIHESEVIDFFKLNIS